MQVDVNRSSGNREHPCNRQTVVCINASDRSDCLMYSTTFSNKVCKGIDAFLENIKLSSLVIKLKSKAMKQLMLVLISVKL